MNLFDEVSFAEIFNRTYEQQSHKFNFYILSKGRAKTLKTPTTLKNIGIDCSIVVEPQEYKDYVEHNPDHNVISMDKNDQGIFYVRNFIKDYSRSRDEEYHWQLDDDIRNFYHRLGKKLAFKDDTGFDFVEQIVTQFSNIGLAGLIHDAFAFARTTPYELNKQCATCVLVNNTTDVRWRPDIIEDTDYSLQHLYTGFCTINFNTLSYLPMPNASMKGGNTQDYISDKLYKRQVKLQEEYPGFFTIYEKDGLSRVRPSKIWQQFKYRPEPQLKDT